MTTPANSPERTASLKSRAIGVPGIVFFVVAAAAPLAATLGSSPVSFMTIGVGTPGAYLLTGIVLVLFAFGYGAMSQHVTSSAGFAAYLERAFGRTAGFGGAALALLAYNGMLLGLYGLFGYLTSGVMQALFGIELSWIVWAAIAWVGVAIFGYLEVNLSARVLGVLMVAEVAILLIFDFAVLFQGGANGVNLDSFQPSNVFAEGFGVALLFAAASFVGFEATAIYGEEAKNPKRTVPIATFVAVVLISVFYTLATWCVALAFGSDAVQQAAIDDPAGFILAANTQFVGQWSTDVMQVLLVTSLFAVLLAFHNTLSRYMFALGRARFLPARLGSAHARWQSPHVASVVGSIVTVIVVGGFYVFGADPYAQLFAWLVGVGTLGVLVLQCITAVAVVVFFTTRKRSELRIWSCVIAPGLSAIGLAVAVGLAWTNWDLLTGATDGVGVLLPWLLPLAVLVGVIAAVATRGRASTLGDTFSANPGDESRALISGAAPPQAGT